MYFDHVQCPACNARFDPEHIQTAGRIAQCPRCNATLRLADLFGVADAFSEEDQPHLTLDDLVPDGNAGGSSGGDTTLDDLVPEGRRLGGPGGRGSR